MPCEAHRPGRRGRGRAAEELCAQLGAFWPELRIVARAADGSRGAAADRPPSPQLVFLDIQMPGLTGLEVAQQAGTRCHVVFVTAYDAHAVAAFEQGAVDYVLKPYTWHAWRSAARVCASGSASG